MTKLCSNGKDKKNITQIKIANVEPDLDRHIRVTLISILAIKFTLSH